MAALYARLAVRITPNDVGARVTVRARNHGPGASAIDAVGMLDAWQDGQLHIVRRDGSTTIVSASDLLAARTVPPPPPPPRPRPPRPRPPPRTLTTTPKPDDHLQPEVRGGQHKADHDRRPSTTSTSDDHHR